MRTRMLGLATVVASLLAASSASAQTAAGGFALNQFEPAPAGDAFFGVPSAAVAGDMKPNVMLLGNYGMKTLRLRNPQTDDTITQLSKSQLYLHLDASLAMFDRLLLNVDVPFAMVQSGDSGVDAKNGKLADIRAGFRVAAFGTYKDPVSLALATDVWIPVGKKEDATGDEKVRLNPKLVLGGNVNDGFVYSMTVGYLHRSKQDLGTAEIGPALTFGAAAGVLLADGKAQIGPEIYGNTVLSSEDLTGKSTTPFLGTHSSPIEAILGAKVRVGDIVLGAGAGPGLTKAPGVAQLRAVASIALVPEIKIGPQDRDKDGIEDPKDACPDTPGVASQDPKLNGCPPPAPKDRDGDQIIDAQDACPDTPGVPNADPAKNGCPADRDGDGVVDAADACPDVPGAADPDPKKNGCPPDKDGDGVPDAQDACPDVAGVKSDDPKKNGCPPDKDGDGIYDKDDACPDVAGVADPDPKKNGCPKLATLVGKEIKISEQVHFDTGKSTIKADSDKLLGEVSAIIKDPPEIAKLRIEGHTDSKGNKAANKVLSSQRADAVKKWLGTKGGVDIKRLEAQGFGQDKPIADNGTEEGQPDEQPAREFFRNAEARVEGIAHEDVAEHQHHHECQQRGNQVADELAVAIDQLFQHESVSRSGMGMVMYELVSFIEIRGNPRVGPEAAMRGLTGARSARSCR